MIKRFTIVALLAAFIAAEADAQNRTYRRRGVIFGGLAGAAIGAAIGDKGDNETAGALIGGAVGAIAGGKIGSQKDQRIEHNRIYHSGPYNAPHGGYHHTPQSQYYRPGYYPSQAPPYPTPVNPHAGNIIVQGETGVRPIVAEDVVVMVRSGMSESMIIEQIHLNGVMHRLAISDVIRLHQLGVSERIIVAMQHAAPSVPSSEVILEPTQSYRAPSTDYPAAGPSIVAPSNTR